VKKTVNTGAKTETKTPAGEKGGPSMFENFILIICFVMVLYGFIRYMYALGQRDANPGVHALWMPAAAFMYAVVLAFDTWVL
jgi:hypothetical protein